MNIVDISIKRPVMATMGLLSLVVFGAMAYFSLQVTFFPEIKIPMVTIQTAYPGASPQVVESQLTKRVEDQVSSISGMESITSYSMESVSIVMATFQFGTDENRNLQEVKDKVELIQSQLPADAERPAITKVDMSSFTPTVNLVIEGDMDPTELYSYAQAVVVDRLSQVDGVGSVLLSGGQAREIRVELDRSTVFERSLPVEQVAGLLAAANVEIPGGNLGLGGMDVPVRLKGEFQSLEDIRDLDVPTATGVFKLRQLALVRDAGSDVRVRTTLSDKASGERNDNTILIQVIKNPTANTISVVDGALEAISMLDKEAAGAVRFKVISEGATFVKDSVDDTLGNIFLGIVFTGLVLLFFLHDLRSTLIVALAMPFSIVSTFLVMKAMGINLNVLSLMGLSSATGTLVANSVVVIENIFRHKALGNDRVEAASKGTKEVVVAIFASTLTNIAVFVPLANMPGIMGSTLSNFAYTIVIATVFSIVVSFTLTPLLASRILPEKKRRGTRLSRALEAMFDSWERAYGRALSFLLAGKKRGAIAVAAVSVLFVASMSLMTRVPFELLPQTDGGSILISVELPQGSSLDATAALLEDVEAAVVAFDEVARTLTTLGSQGSMSSDPSLAQMSVFLAPISDRAESNAAIAASMKRALADIPGAVIRVAPVSEIEVGAGSVVDLYLSGQDNDELKGLAETMLERMSEVPGVVNAASSSKAGKVELVFEPKRKALSEDGLTVQAVAVALRAAVDGLVATTYKEGREEYDIRVSLKDSSLLDIEDLRNIPIVSAAGARPLMRYADVRFADGYSRIMRYNKTRTVELTADLLPGYSQGTSMAAIMDSLGEVSLPSGYALKQAGTSEQLGDTVNDLATVFIVAILLTYMLLAATLENALQPFVILSTVPLSLIGVVLLSLATGAVLNMIAMLGVIMLVGIVVNNAILILDYYNQLLKDGLGPREAMLAAAPRKLKPVLMSNVAIVLGMLPMAMGIGASGAEMRQPMGIVIIGGIVSSTFLALFIIPVLEYLTSKKPRAANPSAPADPIDIRSLDHA